MEVRHGHTFGHACMGNDIYGKDATLILFRRHHRIRNKAKLRPFELVDPRNTELRSTLQKAEFALRAGADVVDPDEEVGDEGTGSASDSG